MLMVIKAMEGTGTDEMVQHTRTDNGLNSSILGENPACGSDPKRQRYFLLGLEFSLYIADNALLVFVTFLVVSKHLDLFEAIVHTIIRSGAVGILEFLWTYIGETYLGTFWALLASTILYSLGLGLLPVGGRQLNPEFYSVVFLLTVGNSGFYWSIGAEKQFIEDKVAEKRERAAGNFVGSFAIPTVIQKICEDPRTCLFGLGLNSQFVVSAFVLVGSLMIFCLGKLFYPIDEGPEGSLLLQIPRVVVAALKKSRVCCNYQEDGEYLVSKAMEGTGTGEIVQNTTGDSGSNSACGSDPKKQRYFLLGLEFSLDIADNALVVFVTFLVLSKHLDPFGAIVFTIIRSGAVGILEFLCAYIGETYLGTFWALLASTILYSLGLGLLPVGGRQLNP
ncbi:hypothetical protein Ancab_013950 [Ancistrocladus abbreviatus]